MKSIPLFVAFLLAATISVGAEISPIRMAVEQISKTESKDKTGHDKTQTRSLKITLNNNSNESFDGLTVKYWFFGHGMTERANKVLSEGERKSSLTPRGKDMVESETLSKHYVEAHAAPAKGGKGGKGGAPTKVPASGEKIVGYAARVMKDGKVLAEYYSELGYKTLIK